MGSGKKIIEFIIVLAFLLPHLFLNIRETQDWGDDFAMYLIEAKNIASDKAINETGHIDNARVMLGPQSYPIGYPLLIAPLIKKAGIDFSSLIVYQSVFLVLALFFGFIFLRNYFSFISSILLTLVMAYNPAMVSFKTEVLSDISFWMFLNLVVVLMIKNRSLTGIIIMACVTAFAIHIRSIGYTLAISTLTFWLIKDYRTKTILTEKKKYIFYIIPLAIVFFLLKIVYPINSSYFFINKPVTADSMALQLSYNIYKLDDFFRFYQVNDYYFITVVCAAFFITFLCIGIAVELKRQTFSFINILTFFFLLVVIIYPYGDAGFRLILPLLSLFCFYFAIGLKQTLVKLELKNSFILVICAVLYLITYYKPVKELHQHRNDIVDGPVTKEFSDLLTFFKNNNIINKRIGVDKSRAMALYSKNKCVSLSDSCFHKDVNEFKLDYVLTHYSATSELKKQLASDTNLFKPLYQNGAFNLYTVKH